jgi:tetratricopeptide (TPR) repeat protein
MLNPEDFVPVSLRSARLRPLLVLPLALVVALATSLAPADDLPPVAEPSLREKIDRLIEQLGDPQFSRREEAQAELMRLGPEAFDALTIAENHLDLEIAARAHYLLALVEFDWAHADDPPEVQRVLADYETLDSVGRLKRIRQLGEHLGIPQVLALCRLVRFEKSHVLSKLAALTIIESVRETSPELDDALLRGTANSPRPAAEWLRVFVRSHREPAAALDQWVALVAAEEQVLDQTPERSRGDIVAALLRAQVDQLKRLDRADDALAVMRRVIEQTTGESESLVQLIRWLVEQRAWQALATVEQRFADRFGSDALLAYTLAEAHLQAGDTQRARELADRAFDMNPGDGTAHYEVGYQLSKRGQLDWAERELRHAIELGPPESFSALKAQFQLADMLHDAERDLEAGRLLEKCLATLERASAEQGENNNGVDLRGVLKAVRGSMTARLNYYLACHWKQQRDRAQELAHLERAIEADPLDADVLIALYRLPEPDEPLRRRTEAQIDFAVRRFREEIAAKARDVAAFEQLAAAYNQLAWLLSNTDRNQQEALNCSLESLKLRPDEAGLLDTLARCYFALGDFENAVKYQTRAVAREPHSGLMQRQLKLFEEALANKRANNG